MFEAAEVEQTIAKEDFKREEATLREQLLDAQGELRHADFPVIIVVGGVDGAGKGETVNTLLEWLDPRYVQTVALGAPTDEERERPRMWRFWRALPSRGRISIFLGGWHSEPIVDRVYRRISSGDMERQLADVVAFERLLVEDGALLVKLWMHLSKDRQRKRLKALAKDKDTRWRVTPADWEHFELYDRFKKVSSTALRKTSTGDAPWTIVGATDRRFQLLSVGRTLLDRLRAQLAARKAGFVAPAAPGSRAPTSAPSAPVSGASPPGTRTILSSLDLAQSVGEHDYDRELERAQGELNDVCRRAAKDGVATAIVFEGVDAAGKGGAIRRVTGALDARMYRVVPIAAPTEEERAHPYLWRFWRALPGLGRIAIFDRSWYGRVLVERVEGFCQPADWKRAYAEINDFEEQLVRVRHRRREVLAAHQPGRAAQAVPRSASRRRASASRSPTEDWRNREKWPDYEPRRERDDRAHVDRDRAVDARRGERQELRAAQGARDGARGDLARAVGIAQSSGIAGGEMFAGATAGTCDRRITPTPPPPPPPPVVLEPGVPATPPLTVPPPPVPPAPPAPSLTPPVPSSCGPVDAVPSLPSVPPLMPAPPPPPPFANTAASSPIVTCAPSSAMKPPAPPPPPPPAAPPRPGRPDASIVPLMMMASPAITNTAPPPAPPDPPDTLTPFCPAQPPWNAGGSGSEAVPPPPAGLPPPSPPRPPKLPPAPPADSPGCAPGMHAGSSASGPGIVPTPVRSSVPSIWISPPASTSGRTPIALTTFAVGIDSVVPATTHASTGPVAPAMQWSEPSVSSTPASSCTEPVGACGTQ